METTQATFDSMIRENPMGETRKDALRLDFDRKLKLEFHGTKVTSDAGLLAYRELDETLGLTSTIDSELRDIRTGKHPTRVLPLYSDRRYTAGLLAMAIPMTPNVSVSILRCGILQGVEPSNALPRQPVPWEDLKQRY